MIKSIFTSFIAMIAGLATHPALASTDEKPTQSQDSEQDFSKVLTESISIGAAIVDQDAVIQPSPEILQILIQLNRTKNQFERPVLIFKNGKILVNDQKQLEKILSRPGQTITSV